MQGAFRMISSVKHKDTGAGYMEVLWRMLKGPDQNGLKRGKIQLMLSWLMWTKTKNEKTQSRTSLLSLVKQKHQ